MHKQKLRQRLSTPQVLWFLLNVGLTRTRAPTATPEDDRGEKAEPRRYALLTLLRHFSHGRPGFNVHRHGQLGTREVSKSLEGPLRRGIERGNRIGRGAPLAPLAAGQA